MASLRTRVDAFMARLEREDVCMHGFMLSVNGELKAQAYYAPFKEGEPHRMYSVSKTMTALGISLLIDSGRLSLDDKITDYFTDWLPETPDPYLMKLKIRDMLRMATCYRWTAYREGTDYSWAKPFFTAKATHEPGTVFHYDTGCSQVLAELILRLTGKNAFDFVNENIWKPLGANDRKYWLCDPSGTNQGGTGLCMSLRDLHRVAQAIMNGGEGVIPAWFCDEMGQTHIGTEMQTNEEERYGYGWQCWRTRAGWAMYGLGGQLAVVCPGKGVLLSTIADTRLDPVGVQRIYNAFFEELYPYIGSEDMEFAGIESAVKPLENAFAPSQEYTSEYTFAENGIGIQALRLVPEGLEITNERGKNILYFGYGSNVIHNFPGWEVPALTSAGWLEGDKLRIRSFLIGDAPCGIDMILAFKADTLTLQCRKSFDPVTNRFEGVVSGVISD